MTTYSKPAIVLGHGLTVLGVIRGLGRAGIESYCHGPLQPIVRRSRYYRPLPGENLPQDEAEISVLLERLQIKSGVLIPCTDRWVRAVAELPENLRADFPSSGPDLQTADLFVDKLRFSELLTRESIPQPLTLPLKTVADLTAADLGRVQSGFLKPVDSQGFGAHFKKKAFTFSDIAEGQRLLNDALSAGFQMILQEYIPGPPTEHYFLDGFVDRNGKIGAWFGRRRLRMYPLDFGNSTYLVSVALSELTPAMNSLERLLTTINYRGIFSAEFKRDPRDGQFRLLEINARPWWYIGFAVDSGVNVAAMAYRDALNLPAQTPPSYRPGVQFVFCSYDAMACRHLLARHELTRWNWTWQWLTARQAILVWYDPLPSLRGWADRMVKSIKRRLGGQPSAAI